MSSPGLARVLSFALCLWLVPSSTARAESLVASTGSAIGRFFQRIGRALLPGSPGDDDLDRALETYEKGRYFTTWVAAERLRARNREPFRDEAALLTGVAAAEAGLRDQAVPALRAVLESSPASPYYAAALGALIEVETRERNDRGAAEAAKRYFVDVWRRPRSKREARINALFLEQGSLSPVEQPLAALPETRAADPRRRDRPADRAVYLAGMALLRQKRFDEAIACFEPILPESAYFPYARYGLAQAFYGRGDFADAGAVIESVYGYGPQTPGEEFLRQRAALLRAQMLHELDEDGQAVAWLRRVSVGGPFGLHARLLAAEIQARREKPALALVYLEDETAENAEPKLLARAAAMDAALRREIGDLASAVRRLERGIGVLERYSTKLRSLSAADSGLDRVRRLLVRQERRRERIDAWRRRSLAGAVPELLEDGGQPGWLSELVGGWMAGDGGSHPIIYYPDTYDPFAGASPPSEPPSDPPPDGLFPPLFRSSLDRDLEEALRHELRLKAVIAEADLLELRFLVLDTELRLQTRAPGRTRVSAVRRLGFGPQVAAAAGERRPRAEILQAALKSAVKAKPKAVDRGELLALARSALARWQSLERLLLSEAAANEERSIQEVRYDLEFDLSQAFAEQERQGAELRRRAGSPPG